MHTPEPRDWPADRWSEEELQRLLADDVLVCEFVELDESGESGEPTEAEEPAQAEEPTPKKRK